MISDNVARGGEKAAGPADVILASPPDERTKYFWVRFRCEIVCVRCARTGRKDEASASRHQHQQRLGRHPRKEQRTNNTGGGTARLRTPPPPPGVDKWASL